MKWSSNKENYRRKFKEKERKKKRKMKEFPENLHVSNKEKFHKINYKRLLAYFRKELYEHIISKEEKDYFVLDTFKRQKGVNNNDMEKMIKTVCTELKDLGWNTQTSYGGTGLFIYANEPPSNCYPDGFN